MKTLARGLPALSTLAAALAFAPLADAQQSWDTSTKPPLDTYWGDPTIPASTWHTNPEEFSPEGSRGFARFEVRGTSAHEESVWVTLIMRVVVTGNFSGVPELSQYWHPSFIMSQQTVIGGSHDDAILPPLRFNALMDSLAVQDSTNTYHVIPERTQPIVPASDVCRWDADYTHWPASVERAMWQNHRVPQNGQVFNLQSMITRTITDQTNGAIDGEDMFYNIGYEAMDTYDMRLEVQAVFMHSNDDAIFYDNTPPKGPKGTFLAVGTSTPLTYKFNDSLGPINGKAYPTIANYTPYVGTSLVQAGQGFPLSATFVTKPSSATVLVNAPGFPPTSMKFIVHKFNGQPLKVYVPAWMPVGTQGEIMQLHTAFGDLAVIPSPHRDLFSVY